MFVGQFPAPTKPTYFKRNIFRHFLTIGGAHCPLHETAMRRVYRACSTYIRGPFLRRFASYEGKQHNTRVSSRFFTSSASLPDRKQRSRRRTADIPQLLDFATRVARPKDRRTKRLEKRINHARTEIAKALGDKQYVSLNEPEGRRAALEIVELFRDLRNTERLVKTTMNVAKSQIEEMGSPSTCGTASSSEADGSVPFLAPNLWFARMVLSAYAGTGVKQLADARVEYSAWYDMALTLGLQPDQDADTLCDMMINYAAVGNADVAIDFLKKIATGGIQPRPGAIASALSQMSTKPGVTRVSPQELVEFVEFAAGAGGALAESLTPDAMADAVHACQNKGSSTSAEKIFSIARSLGAMNPRAAGNILLGYARAGRFEEAEKITAELKSLGARFPVGAAEGLIEALGKVKRFDEAEKLLNEVVAGNRGSSVALYTKYLKTLLDADRVDDARRVLDDMKIRGVSPSKEIHYVYINWMLSSEPDSKCAEKYALEEAQCPDAISFILHRYAKLGLLQQAERLVELTAQATGVDVTTKMLTVLLDCAGKGSGIDKARRILSLFDQHGCKPNTVTINTLMSILLRSGRNPNDVETEAADMYTKLGLKMDSIGFNQLIQAHSAAGDMASARACLGRMQSQGLRPDNSTFSSMAQPIALAGDVEAVWKLRSELFPAKFGPPPNATITSVLVALDNSSTRRPDVVAEVLDIYKAQHGVGALPFRLSDRLQGACDSKTQFEEMLQSRGLRAPLRVPDERK